MAGISETNNGSRHAFLYSEASGMKDLGTLGGRFSVAYDVNDAGQVAGRSATRNGEEHAFVYDAETGMKDLGTFGGPSSLAGKMNRRGQIVGFAADAERQYRAFLYSGGKMIDLNTVVDPGASWLLTHANDINDSGQIVGWGTGPGRCERAYLLTPKERDWGLGIRNRTLTDND